MEDYEQEFHYDSKEDVDLLKSNLKDFIEFGQEYKVKGENVGWRNKSGIMEISFNSLDNFLEKMIPNTSFDLILYTSEDKDGFMIELYHHDSPTGEKHYFYPK